MGFGPLSPKNLNWPFMDYEITFYSNTYWFFRLKVLDSNQAYFYTIDFLFSEINKSFAISKIFKF